jgi:hypothetical protein
MEITLEEIQKKFESLPENLKWAIMAANVDDNIIEISQENGLNVEQMGQLSLETHMEMFGFTPPEKFEESVKNSLKLSDEKTKEIVNAINEKIFKAIRSKMMEPSVEREEDEENKDTQILSSAGIEIVSPRLNKEGAGGGDAKESPHPILVQKLSGFVKNEVKETEHSLQNLSSTNTEKMTSVKNIPTIDPYREIPE